MSETTGTSSFLQELEEWYTWLDNALVLDALMRVANEEAEQSSTGTWLALLYPPAADACLNLLQGLPRVAFAFIWSRSPFSCMEDSPINI